MRGMKSSVQENKFHFNWKYVFIIRWLILFCLDVKLIPAIYFWYIESLNVETEQNKKTKLKKSKRKKKKKKATALLASCLVSEKSHQWPRKKKTKINLNKHNY
jgi:phosphate/sulfate permease